MWPLATDVVCSVCPRVCLLDITLSHAKTAKPIEMPFGLWDLSGPMEPFEVGAQIPKMEIGNFEGTSYTPLRYTGWSKKSGHAIYFCYNVSK